MSELTTQQPDLTKQQAEKVIAFYKNNACLNRHILLLMFERKAHKAYNFTSFEEFCNIVLVMDSSKSVISQKLGWAKVERNLFGTRFDLKIVDKQVDESLPAGKLLEVPEAQKGITKRIYEELSRLNDDPELQKRAFDEFKAVAAANVGTLAQQETNLSRIVDRFKRRVTMTEEPVTPAIPEPLSAPTKEAQSLTPVQNTPAKEEPAPVVTPVSTSTPKPVVSTFVPEPDIEVVAETTFRRWEEALNIALTWVENEVISGTPRDIKEVQEALLEVKEWASK